MKLSVTVGARHDLSYSINIDKIQNELEWETLIRFENGIIQTAINS